jgi:hypothetical protein
VVLKFMLKDKPERNDKSRQNDGGGSLRGPHALLDAPNSSQRDHDGRGEEPGGHAETRRDRADRAEHPAQ